MYVTINEYPHRLPPPYQTLRYSRRLPTPSPLSLSRKIMVPNPVPNTHVPRGTKPVPPSPWPYPNHLLLMPRRSLHKLLHPIQPPPSVRFPDRHPGSHRNINFHPPRHLLSRQSPRLFLPPLFHAAFRSLNHHPPGALVPRFPS